MKNLLSQDGPVMRAITDLTTLVFLNILTAIFCIPVVTAGASLAAMHYVIIEMIEERGGGLVSEFWKRFKENLKNATPVWLILLAAAVFLYVDYRIIAGGELGLPRAMLIPYLLLNVTRLLPLFFLLGLSLPAYFCALLYMPVFEKMIGKREDEDRPWVLDDEDTEGK